MYTTCLFCNSRLETNRVLEDFPVGRRLAFDAERGRLWVICRRCGRWNLTPLEERWGAIDVCERLFRKTRLRVASQNVGLARLADGLELVRIGRALRSEVAAWRYGPYLPLWAPAEEGSGIVALFAGGLQRARDAVNEAAFPRLRLPYDLPTWLSVHGRSRRTLAFVIDGEGQSSAIRYGHLDATQLLRPERHEHWRVRVRHDRGFAILSGDAGLRVAGKLLAALNGWGATPEHIRAAIAKLDEAGDPGGYFTRIAALTTRTSWGRFPDAPRGFASGVVARSAAERLALHLATRSFWGRGGTGSEPSTALPRLPIADRLALEMAANEDIERQAAEGELRLLHAAWREAEEIAAIADGLLRDPTASSRAAWSDVAQEGYLRSWAPAPPTPELI